MKDDVLHQQQHMLRVAKHTVSIAGTPQLGLKWHLRSAAVHCWCLHMLHLLFMVRVGCQLNE